MRLTKFMAGGIFLSLWAPVEAAENVELGGRDFRGTLTPSRLELRFPSLPTPDVGPLVWFAAPLLDLLVFGVLGLGLGLVAEKWRAGAESQLTLLICLALSLVGAFMVLPPCLLSDQIQLRGTLLKFFIASLAGSLTFAMSLLFFRFRRDRCQRLFDCWFRLPGRFSGGGHALVGIVLISALTISWKQGPAALERPLTDSCSEKARPNIVLLTLDATTAGHYSCYGYARPTTPNIDRLARQGVLFENAITPSSWTLPSFASMFTGLLPHQHGADYAVPLSNHFATLAEILRSQGYETAGFNANFLYGQKSRGIGRGFEVYEDGSSSLQQNLVLTVAGRVFRSLLYFPFIRPDFTARRNAQQINQEVFRWYQGRSRRPFFLFVNYFDAHNPYLAPPPYEDRFGRLPYPLARRTLHQRNKLQSSEHLSPSERASLVDGYDNVLAYTDEQVGELMNSLRRTTEWSNTVIIVTSDLGESFGEHGSYGHGWGLYRELLHVPLIIVGPGVPAGLRVRTVVPTRSIFDTILGLANFGDTSFSHSALQRFWTPGADPDEFSGAVVSEIRSSPESGSPAAAAVSLTTPEWHYIFDSQGHDSLYNWSRDPLETTDLSGSPDRDRIVQNLRATLHDRLIHTPHPWVGTAYLLPFHSPGFSFSQGGFSRNGPESNSSPGSLNPQSRDLLNTLPYY